MPQEPTELTSPYDPNEHEPGILNRWAKAGYTNPDACIRDGHTSADAAPYTIVLPPPNVTGVLHLGHALGDTIEDIMIRYKRMRGYRTLWIPGTDHAAIATQSKAEKQLEKDGIKKQDLSREQLFAKIQEFALDNQDTIKKQLERLGASLDWSREAFTLDRERERAVRAAFTRMHKDGLIYQKEKVVNWDPKGRTTVSDDEVVHEPGTATLYTFRYSSDIPIPIATTRPETKLGDTAIAVHPEDERYNQYIGQTFRCTFAGEPLTLQVIGDETIDSEFGTGAVGVTPAHSTTDFELAERHTLELKTIIDERARMLVGADGIKGEKTADARNTVVTWLCENDLLEATEEVEQNLSKAQRSGGVVEPLPKMQWFIDVNKEFTLQHSAITGIESGQTVTLKSLMRAAVENGDVTFIPERYIKNYYHWIDNLRDWCISRQIIYGHRIPVWYQKDADGTITDTYVGVEDPVETGWEQDPDTLDTWFSSGLWTFSTLGWPDQTDDLATYHPTSMLETGHDILFFWIARMILMSTYHLGEVPFRNVYLHGTVRDAEGRTMSKSLGNGIDPMEVIEKYGTDALRMALIVGNTPGTDLSVSYDKFKAYKRFANKLWNIARFVLSHTDGSDFTHPPELRPSHKQYIDRFDAFAREITSEMDAYQFHLTADKLYNYCWHTLADEIIEELKASIQSNTEAERASAAYTLYYLLHHSLILLHPYMPFITETLWSLLPVRDGAELLMVRSWPIESE